MQIPRDHLQSPAESYTLARVCAISSAVERLLHTQEVTGSNPVSRTIFSHLEITRKP